MTNKQWPPRIDRDDEREWTDHERALWQERYSEVVALGWKNAPKSIEELLTNHRVIGEAVPVEHRPYFTGVLLTSELFLDVATRIVALEANQ